MLRPIVRHGAAVLHRPAEPVTEITPEIDALVDDMIQTMYAAPGIGLAAPQVGVGKRVFVCDVSIGRNPADLLVFINPEFVERDGMQLEEEGCLSVPASTRRSPGRLEPSSRVSIGMAIRSRSRPRACSPAASSTRWITSRARCSSIVCAACRRI
jgi:peptide deformylase